MKTTVTLAVLLVSVPLSCVACFICNTPPTPKDAVRMYPVVFIGTVESDNHDMIRFAVKEVFSGHLERQAVMYRDGSSCNFGFQQGKTYLVYTTYLVFTTPDQKGTLAAAHNCSRTSEISKAAADIKTLRADKSAPSLLK